MSLFRHILFPVDFSERCRATAPAVMRMAAHCQAKLTLLHALDLPPGAYADWYAFSSMIDVDAIRASERKMLENFPVDEGLEVQRVLLDGPPVQAIVKHADNYGVDLIMMPTHGYGRFRSLLLGSITAGVLHDAHCAVWTAAHSEEGGLPVECYKVLCTTDLSEATPKLLNWAQCVAREFDARLRVIHVLPAVADPAHSAGAAEFRRHLHREAKAKFEALAARAGVDVELELVDGVPGESIGQIVARHADGVDLVIAGRGVIQGTFGRLRTHVSDIIRLSPCPVLSV
jgi:nucleotide-binding universal stress UspA family protein